MTFTQYIIYISKHFWFYKKPLNCIQSTIEFFFALGYRKFFSYSQTKPKEASESVQTMAVTKAPKASGDFRMLANAARNPPDPDLT